MNIKSFVTLALCGCLLAGCGSSQFDRLDNVQSIEEEAENVEREGENKRSSKSNQDNYTSGNANKKKSEFNSNTNNQTEKKEQDSSSFKKEQNDKWDTKRDVDTLAKGAEEQDLGLFDNGQEEVIHNDNESPSDVLDISAFKAYTTNVVTFGLYEQDNNLENGPEEIEWFKIDSPDVNKTLLVSKYVLSAAHGDVINGWNNSEMREWLNGEFYENAFTSEEKEKILENDSACASKEVTINTSIDGVITARVREESSVKDKVFILSMDGITGNLEEIEKMCVITPYAAYEPQVILEERYVGSSENIDPKDYDYALASMATRCSIDVDLDYAERGTVVLGGPDYGFGGFFGSTPFVGLGIRPCIWISK